MEIYALGLDSLDANLKREEYAEASGEESALVRELNSKFLVSEFDSDHFDLAANLELRVSGLAKGPLLTISVLYSGHFHPKEGKFQRQHASALLRPKRG